MQVRYGQTRKADTGGSSPSSLGQVVDMFGCEIWNPGSHLAPSLRMKPMQGGVEQRSCRTDTLH